MCTCLGTCSAVWGGAQKHIAQTAFPLPFFLVIAAPPPDVPKARCTAPAPLPSNCHRCSPAVKNAGDGRSFTRRDCRQKKNSPSSKRFQRARRKGRGNAVPVPSVLWGGKVRFLDLGFGSEPGPFALPPVWDLFRNGTADRRPRWQLAEVDFGVHWHQKHLFTN